MGLELKDKDPSEPKRCSEKLLATNTSTQDQDPPVVKRRSQNLGEFKPSPLMGGSAGKKSFVERRKQLMAQKQSGN